MRNYEKIVLYGAGRNCIKLFKQLPRLKEIVLCIFDQNPTITGQTICGIPICDKSEIRNYADYRIYITISSYGSELESELNTVAGKHLSYIRENDFLLLIFDFYKENFKVDDSKDFNIVFLNNNGLCLGGVESWIKDLACAFIQKKNAKTKLLLGSDELVDVPSVLINHIITTNASVNDYYNALKKMLPCKIIISNIDMPVYAAFLLKMNFPDFVEIYSVLHNEKYVTCKNNVVFSKYIQHFICVATNMKNQLLLENISEKKIDVIPCPLNIPKGNNRTYSVEKSFPIRIGYAGRITNIQKRMDLMLKMILVLEKYNVNYYFSFAGSGDGLEDVLEFISKYKLDKKIRYIGMLTRSEITYFWQEQDICVNIADWEGRSISIMEAMVNGSVPVVTHTSGVDDDIVDGENGYIVKLGDYTQMAEKIVYLEKNRHLLPVMGSKAYNEVKEKCDIDLEVELWTKILGLSDINKELSN